MIVKVNDAGEVLIPVELVQIEPFTEATAEIVAQVGAEEAAKGNVLPLGDLIIGVSALEPGYAVGTGNLRDFRRIPGLAVIAL
jgi:predicted nucleic acid-binding protein